MIMFNKQIDGFAHGGTGFYEGLQFKIYFRRLLGCPFISTYLSLPMTLVVALTRSINKQMASLTEVMGFYKGLQFKIYFRRLLGCPFISTYLFLPMNTRVAS